MSPPVLIPQVHGAAAHLLFANPDDSNDPGHGRYFGFVSQFDRSFELATQDATFEAAGENWRFNHNPSNSVRWCSISTRRFRSSLGISTPRMPWFSQCSMGTSRRWRLAPYSGRPSSSA